MTNSGLYLHIPFCERKCNYCSFFSCKKSTEEIDAYVDALCVEANQVAKAHKDKRIDTVYFGGGTPSLLTIKQFDKIFSAIYNNYEVSNDCEITVEVNPNTAQNIFEYKKFGVNRLSIGTQSSNDNILKVLGRLHTAEEAINTLIYAREYYDNISTDIILGVNGEQNAEEEFLSVYKYVTHISAYMLSLEEGTPLRLAVENKKIAVATDDEVVDQYEKFVKIANEYGYYRYETSNFALKGRESRHNSRYWNLSPYIGLGAGAHSYVDGVRYYNKENIEEYIRGINSGYEKAVFERGKDKKADKYEYVMLSLRTVKGVNIREYNAKFDADFISEYKNRIKKAEKYICISEDSLYILPQYFSVQNAIIRIILP